MEKMLKIVICIYTISVCRVFAREPDKIVTIDKLRWKFLQLEETLWNSVLDYAENNIGEKKDNPEVMLVKKFGQFGDMITDEMGEVCVKQDTMCYDLVLNYFYH